MDTEKLNAFMGKFVEEGYQSGVLKDTAGLKATSEGLRIRQTGGKLIVTDGPFTEAKEVIGGYALVEVKSSDEALIAAMSGWKTKSERNQGATVSR